MAARPRLVDGPDLSIVVPARNEAASLDLLVERVRGALDGTTWSWELILIDDGSTDGSDARIEALASEEPRVRGRLLAGHQGKSAALACGIDAARGEIIVMMDADLQDLPEEIAALVEPVSAGSLDLAQGWRVDRQDASHKVFASAVFNGLCSAFSGLEVHDVNCGYKAMRVSVARKLVLNEGMHRFIPVQAWRAGFTVGEVQVRHAHRAFGRSRYGALRYLRGLNDLVGAVLLPRLLIAWAPILAPTGLVALAGAVLSLGALGVLGVMRRAGLLWELGLTAMGLAAVGVLCLALSTLGQLTSSIDGRERPRAFRLRAAIERPSAAQGATQDEHQA